MNICFQRQVEKLHYTTYSVWLTATKDLKLRHSISLKNKKAKSDPKAPRPHQIGFCKGNTIF